MPSVFPARYPCRLSAFLRALCGLLLALERPKQDSPEPAPHSSVTSAPKAFTNPRPGLVVFAEVLGVVAADREQLVGEAVVLVAFAALAHVAEDREA